MKSRVASTQRKTDFHSREKWLLHEREMSSTKETKVLNSKETWLPLKKELVLIKKDDFDLEGKVSGWMREKGFHWTEKANAKVRVSNTQN